jgi:sulfate transport system permease protein
MLAPSIALPAPAAARSRATAEPWVVRWLLIGLALGFLGLFLMVPLAAVLTEALRKGVQTYFAALSEPDAVSAIKLTCWSR